MAKYKNKGLWFKGRNFFASNIITKEIPNSKHHPEYSGPNKFQNPSTKIQAPKSKHQNPNKFQNLNPK
jgi:hypothetical protein